MDHDNILLTNDHYSQVSHLASLRLEILFSEWFEFPVTALYLNEEYLQQKYVTENLSADEVASEIGCAVSTVLKHLKKYGIPVRESGQNIRPKRHLPFGCRRTLKNGNNGTLPRLAVGQFFMG